MGGVSYFQQYTQALLQNSANDETLRARGLILLGVPGSGKSQAVRCMANASGRSLVTMNIGALRSKYQGESDANIREALRIADAMAPCILFVDELEKGISGVQSSGATDGGTGARMFGTLLTWLNDHKSDVFFVGTCNDVQALIGNNPEFVRAGRFDGTFFFDLPTAEDREKIWNIYIKKFKVSKPPDMDTLLQLSDNWTGAEIEACCRLSTILRRPITEQAPEVTPIMQTAAEQLRALRVWADDRCLSARSYGKYKRTAENTAVAPTILDRAKNRKRRAVDSDVPAGVDGADNKPASPKA
jgi:SpoVK/Ycf46/Vps4 family AAA+-type ATPase